MTFKPNLAATCDDTSKIQFPVMASVKLDGYRCCKQNGVAVSRNLKPIPNEFVQAALVGVPDGVDGELIIGLPYGTDVWNRSAGVMKKGTTPDFKFYVFDWDLDLPYHERYDRLASLKGLPHVSRVKHEILHDVDELNAFEDRAVTNGYEGIMIRSPMMRYKYGRSTVKENGLMKIKRWLDAEGRVVGFVEQMHNGNEATVDLLGRTKRSTSKAGKTGKDTLGALIVEWDVNSNTPLRSVQWGQFELGSGYTDALRREIWDNQDAWLGKVVTFKYQALTVENAPRFPIFKGERLAGDLDVKE